MSDKVESPWQVARVKTAEAYSLVGHLILIVTGDKPAPCYQVRIEHVFTIAPPDTFIVEWRQNGPCPQVVTPYREVAIFNIGSTPDKIAVLTAEGTKTVTVKHLPLREGAAAEAKTAGPRTATGYSSAFSFEEALNNAIRKLPPNFPDELQHFTVTETGAIVGGIAGIHRMFVTIRD
jgi:hypothetical protein